MIKKKATFLGFCSLPFVDRETFLDKQIIAHLYLKYKKGLEYNEDNPLFKAKSYYVWGKYDVCTIAEVDDFEFATRFFRSNNPIGNQTDVDSTATIELENFDYKVITGIQSQSNYEEAEPNIYIGITQLKINSTFLIGNGHQMISIIKKALKPKLSNVKFTICESFSYHELLLVIYSDSIHLIKDCIKSIREMEINHLQTFCNPKEKYQEIINHSIFNCLIEKDDEIDNGLKGKNFDPKKISNHVFESTQTTFGVNTEIFVNPKKFEANIITEKISFFTKLNVKPGHINSVLNTMTKSASDEYLVAGKGDIMVHKMVEVTSLDCLKIPAEYLNKQTKDSIVESYTTVAFPLEKESESPSYDAEYHIEIHHKLKNFIINQELLTKLKGAMKEMMLPKVLTEKIMKIISNYDNAALNPDMYSSYVEIFWNLKENFYNTIINYNNNNPLESENKQHFNWRLIRKLEEACLNIESSFQNRFYQSYWTSEILEVNVDYTGGFQNLITAYDSCVKVINNTYMPNNRNSTFVYIKSNHEVFAQENVIQFNYLHLIQPYIFCSVVMHELSNFIFEKWFANKYDISNLPCKEYGNKINRLLFQADIKLSAELSYTGNLSEMLMTQELSEELLNELATINGENLLGLFSKDSLRYFLIDTVNLLHGYKNNYELFRTTSWAYFIQLGNRYDARNILNDADYCIMYFRLAVVKRFFGFKECIIPKSFENFLKDQEDRLSVKVNFFIDKIFKKDRIETWFELWREIIAEKGHFSIIPQMPKTNYDLPQIENYLLGTQDIYDEEDLDILIASIDDLCEASNDDLYSIYQKIILTTLEQTSSNIDILLRNNTNGEPKPIADINKNRIFIDPCGGTFVVSEKSRGEYYFYRERFIRLMFHLSQIHKKLYVKDILDLPKGSKKNANYE